MVQIELSEAEAKLALACIDVGIDSFASTMQDEVDDWEEQTRIYADASPKFAGTVMTLDPGDRTSQSLLLQLSFCPCKDSRDYDPSGYAVDDISSLASKLRGVGVGVGVGATE